MGSILGWGKRTFWVLGGLAVAVPVILWAMSSGHKQDPAPKSERPQPEKEKTPPPKEEESVTPAESESTAPAPVADVPAETPVEAPTSESPAPEPEVAEAPVETAVAEITAVVEPEVTAAPIETPVAETPVAVEPEASSAEPPTSETPVVVEPEVAAAPVETPVAETPAVVESEAAIEYPEDIWEGVAQAGQYYSRDRRKWVRGNCLLPASILSSRGEARGDILNVCPNGLRVRAHGGHAESPFVSGEEVKITLIDPALTVTAKVEWSAQDAKFIEEAGLTFVEPSVNRHIISEILQRGGWNSSHYRQRRQSRLRFAQDCPASLSDSQGNTFDVHLFSIGEGGAGVRLAESLKVGEQVGLSISTGKKKGDFKLPAVIVDVRGESHHLKFLPMPQGLRKRFDPFLKSLENN